MNSKNKKSENFADTQSKSSGSSTGKTFMWIGLLIFFICVIIGLVYFIRSQKLDIDFTRGFKSNLSISNL